ncbi:hypothetical protein [uncultured Tateyamaria sp.]|uniref:ATP-binding protein n=1 Tax=Tateyamaria sp. 1078 TaxID=3417464 RepID=UPI0026101D6D|nr:hypothetical protein [uncultured Tateyamaria sp.]
MENLNKRGQSYSAPFGRFRFVGASGSDETLVGREKQRGRLTRILLDARARTAVLVTGRRGIGKTTFVDACIDDYERLVFRRFLRSDHGKSWLDHFVLIAIATLIGFLLLVAADLLELFSPQLSNSPLLIIGILPAGLVAILPLILSIHMAKAASRIHGVGTPLPWVSFLSFAGTGAICIWFSQNAPALFMSRALLGLAVLGFLGETTNFGFLRPLGWEWTWSRFKQNLSRLVRTTIRFGIPFFIMIFGIPSMLNLLPILDWVSLFPVSVGDTRGATLQPTDEILNNFGLAAVATGGMLVAKYARARRGFPSPESLEFAEFERKLGKLGGLILLVTVGTVLAFWFIEYVIAVQSGTDASGLIRVNWLSLGVLAALVVTFVAITQWRLFRTGFTGVRDNGHAQIWHPISEFLVFKAVILATVSTQIVYGALGLVVDPKLPDSLTDYCDIVLDSGNTMPGTAEAGGFVFSNYSDESSFKGWPTPVRAPDTPRPALEPPMCTSKILANEFFVSLQGNANKLGNPPITINFPKDADGKYLEPETLAFSLFAGPWEETAWLCFFVLIVLLAFFLDYEWINRPGVSVQDARAINPAMRRKWRPGFEFDPIAIWVAQARTVRLNKGHGGQTSSKVLESMSRTNFEALEERRREVIHLIESTTMGYAVYRSMMQSTVVRVNLGFDELNHRGVTLAMLTGLRSEYRKKFLGFRSEIAMSGWLTKLLIASLVTTYIARSLIDFPAVDAMPETHQQAFISAPLIDATDTSDDQSRTTGLTRLRVEYCEYLKWHDINGFSASSQFTSNSAAVPLAFCRAFPAIAEAILPVMFLPLLSVELETQHLSDKFIFHVLHKNNGLPEIVGKDRIERVRPELVLRDGKTDNFELENPEDPSFRLYHLILLLLVMGAINGVIRIYPIVPYSRTAARIDELINMLVAHQMHGERHGWNGGSGWLSSVFSREKYSEVRKDNLDPRMVEYQLFGILEDMQRRRLQLPFETVFSVSIPRPEITFVFDELDKITGLVGTDKPDRRQIEDIEALDAERQRAYALRGLLSDMKRVISAAPARFIFVGNRLLHDEWIADATRRTPLLTSIFDEEIYLPSLLLDTGSVTERAPPQNPLWDRTFEYLHRVHKQSERNYRRALQMRTSPFMWQTNEPLSRQAYSDTHVRVQEIRGAWRFDKKPEPEFGDVWLKLYRSVDGQQIDYPGSTNSEGEPIEDRTWRRAIITDFVRFLTLRSMGNPKKLQQQLGEFIAPAARVAPPPADMFKDRRGMIARDLEALRRVRNVFCEDDVLHFEDHDIYRIQLVGTLFRHARETFARSVVPGDDKRLLSMFYMYEFLFKFHGRGFSWGSLERIEEMAHMHRAPELRSLMHEVLDSSSERFLHKILNGMYAFRFRSDFSVEMRRLSRLFETEQAAFNFTLDESQSLKATYIALLEKSPAANIDLVTALGELYEYDQDFDSARHHYRHAIRINDETLFYHVGSRLDSTDPFATAAEARLPKQGEPLQDFHDLPILYAPGQAASEVATLAAFLGPDREIKHNFLVYAPWAVRRLRLMLKIGLTYEQVNDLEMAQLHYRDATKTSLELIDLLQKSVSSKSPTGNDMTTLKHMNVVYQAIFAEAWVSQKLPSSVDGSISIVEDALHRLRKSLPILSDPQTGYELAEEGENTAKSTETSDAVGGVTHAHLALIGSEMHNKAGDLYFFKGRSFLVFNRLKEVAEKGIGTGAEGTVLKAHYHYAVGLHEVRRFVTYRRKSSEWKFNVGTQRHQTFERGGWADFVYLSAASNLADMADAVLARTSILSLYDDFSSVEKIVGPPDEMHEAFTKATDAFFEGDDISTSDDPYSILTDKFFGTWQGNDETNYPQLVLFGEPSPSIARVVAGLNFIACGARLNERAGFLDDAASEYLMAAQYAASQLQRLRTFEAASYALGQEVTENETDDTNPSQNMSEFQTAKLDLLEMLKLTICGEGRKQHRLDTVKVLVDFAYYCCGEYGRLKKLASARQDTDYLVGGVVLESAVTTVCDLILCTNDLLKHEFDLIGPQLPIVAAIDETVNGLERFLEDWLKDSYDAACVAGREAHLSKFDAAELNYSDERMLRVRSILNYLLIRHPFPVLNQVYGLQVLIDDALLSEPNPNQKQTDPRTWTNDASRQVYDYIREINRLAEQLEAPMHVTPIEIGRSAAFWVLRETRFGNETTFASYAKQSRVDEILKVATNALRASRESYTMGRHFRNSISRMQYLFDDFNDRKLHTKHGLQMSDMELCSVLEHLINEYGKCRMQK